MEKLLVSFVVCMFVCLSMTNGRPTTSNSMSREQAETFLRRYGYLDEDATADAEYGNSLRMFQQMMGIAESGLLDPDTSEMMGKSRCGRKDMNDDPEEAESSVLASGNTRTKRQTNQYMWTHTPVTYAVEPNGYWSEIDQVTEMEQDLVIGAAIEEWNQYMEGVLSLEEQSNGDSTQADMAIKFGSGSHGSVYPWDDAFDGPGGVLAHAFYPLAGSPTSGDIHMDADEDWESFDAADESLESGKLYTIFLHELGHALGLDHTDDSDAVMFPVYFNNIASLQTDDIQRICEKYGAQIAACGVSEPTTTTTSATTTTAPTTSTPSTTTISPTTSTSSTSTSSPTSSTSTTSTSESTSSSTTTTATTTTAATRQRERTRQNSRNTRGNNGSNNNNSNNNNNRGNSNNGRSGGTAGRN